MFSLGLLFSMHYFSSSLLSRFPRLTPPLVSPTSFHLRKGSAREVKEKAKESKPMVSRKEINPLACLLKASKGEIIKHAGRPQPRNLPVPLGFLLVMAFAPQNVGRFVNGASCTRGSLFSFSQCSTQCEHLHITTHEPASQLTELVSAVNRTWENVLCASGQNLALAGVDGITHWSPILSSPQSCLPISPGG